MSRYHSSSCDHDRKASGVAVGGLVTGIIGTSLAGLLVLSRRRGGLLGGGGGEDCERDAMAVYDKAALAKGQEAITELHIVEKWI